MASEGPEDNQDFQLEFVNCSTPASMADDYEDGDQTLEEECADSVSSVYDEPAPHLLRKSPRKSVILSGTYKISKGKPPFKSRQYKVCICKVIFPLVFSFISFVSCIFNARLK